MEKKWGDGGIDSDVWKELEAGMCAFVRSVGEGVAPWGGCPREARMEGRESTEDGKELQLERIPGRREGHMPVAI